MVSMRRVGGTGKGDCCSSTSLYIVDPVVVDEMEDIARISGLLR